MRLQSMNLSNEMMKIYEVIQKAGANAQPETGTENASTENSSESENTEEGK